MAQVDGDDAVSVEIITNPLGDGATASGTAVGSWNIRCDKDIESTCATVAAGARCMANGEYKCNDSVKDLCSSCRCV